MNYIIGEHFEMAYDPDFSVVTLNWLLPSLNELQTEYDELFDVREYDELLNEIMQGWKHREFLEYFYDEVSDRFYDEILQSEKRTGIIKDIKLLEEADRKRLICWWSPPEWFVEVYKKREATIINQHVLESIGDRI